MIPLSDFGSDAQRERDHRLGEDVLFAADVRLERQDEGLDLVVRKNGRLPGRLPQRHRDRDGTPSARSHPMPPSDLPRLRGRKRHKVPGPRSAALPDPHPTSKAVNPLLAHVGVEMEADLKMIFHAWIVKDSV